MGYVYSITNNHDGRQYVGMTLQTIWERIAGHIRASELCEPKYPLAADIRSLGMSNFTVEILFESDDWLELRKQERELIYSRQAYEPFGYNRTNFKDYTDSEGWHHDDRNTIVNELTGEVYASLSETARNLNVDRQTICRYLDPNYPREKRTLSIQIRRLKVPSK